MNHEAAAATICRQGREKGAKFQGGAQKGRKTHILTIILSCITMNCACFCKFQIGIIHTKLDFVLNTERMGYLNIDFLKEKSFVLDYKKGRIILP